MIKEKLEKLSRLALCPTAPHGEQDAAAAAVFRLLRHNGLRSLSWGKKAEEKIRCKEYMRFPFGKHKNKKVDFVADHDPEYCTWFLKNIEKISPYLRKDIEEALRNRKP
jgi:hypothetical protein